MRHLGEGAGPQGDLPYPHAGSCRPIRCSSPNTDKCALVESRILYTYRLETAVAGWLAALGAGLQAGGGALLHGGRDSLADTLLLSEYGQMCGS